MSSTHQSDPNFPPNLDIKPSVLPSTQLPDHLPFGLQAQEEAIRKYGIAGRVWEAAYALAQYVSPGTHLEYDPPFLASESDPASRSPFTLIELGAGTGMLSACIATVLDNPKDTLIVTDLPEVCPMLEDNLRALTGNSNPEKISVYVHPLSWGNRQDIANIECFRTRLLTHVICSDLVYFTELFAPLLRTLLQLTSYNNDRFHTVPPTIIISYKIRSLPKETLFWSAFGLWFEFIPVLQRCKEGSKSWQRLGSDFEDKTFIFVARRRPQSYTWNIPSEDDKLLHGVGAYERETRQSDDTFEIMLLLSMDGDITE